MPIRPENKPRYPKEWPQIRERILTRAGQQLHVPGGKSVYIEARCERCGVRNHALGTRDAAGTFHELGPMEGEVAELIDGEKVLQIVLTIAHVHDPSPENCADDNLAAWCQRCHLNHDRAHHNVMRVQNAVERDVSRGQGVLFQGGVS